MKKRISGQKHISVRNVFFSPHNKPINYITVFASKKEAKRKRRTFQADAYTFLLLQFMH